MCGRFVLSTEEFVKLATRFLVEKNNVTDYSPSYNIAPSQNSIVITKAEGITIASHFRWGLVPYWAKDLSIGSKMINARAETIDQKPSFKPPFRRYRLRHK
ncbi:MAG: SOS response-associated peptidase family protein [Clostridia bacterium]|jgi:putative SOS response-associated peptidase YedK|nr:SOS response-associated peptidase family protein [Clostridia bacterium]